MLRASIATYNSALNPATIVTGVGDTGVEYSAELIAFVDAVVLRDRDEYQVARTTLEGLIGKGPTDRAAMVAGNFSMMNRALDAVGAPVDKSHTALALEMGISIPSHIAAR